MDRDEMRRFLNSPEVVERLQRYLSTRPRLGAAYDVNKPVSSWLPKTVMDAPRRPRPRK
jgi:hypothetical protein